MRAITPNIACRWPYDSQLVLMFVPENPAFIPNLNCEYSVSRKTIDLAREAAEAHSNLNLWGAVIALLESGLIYGGRDEAAHEIISLCKTEQQAELKIYDESLAKLK
mgnify:FL=1